jgi:hypothetical protein
VPEGGDHVAVAAGDGHGLALEEDGGLVGWGTNWYGESDVPEGGGHAAIAAGGYHNVALKADGSLVAWGNGSAGQTDVPEGTGYVAVAAGYYHSLAIERAGRATIADVLASVRAADLDAGIAHALVTQLERAETALAAGGTRAARGAVDAAIRLLRAQSGRKVPAPTAEALIEDLDAIRTSIGG